LEVWDGECIRALATRGLPASFQELAAFMHEGWRV
jgi:hypothetical protein